MKLPLAKLLGATCARRVRPGAGSRGFSLIELVVVLVIIGIISAIGMPRLSSTLARSRADAAARRIVTDLELAQSRAYARNTTQQVAFTISSNSYQIVGMTDRDRGSGTYTVKLGERPYNAVIKTVDFGGQQSISFDAYGQPASGGTVVVMVGSTSRTITLYASSGRAKVQ